MHAPVDASNDGLSSTPNRLAVYSADDCDNKHLIEGLVSVSAVMPVQLASLRPK